MNSLNNTISLNKLEKNGEFSKNDFKKNKTESHFPIIFYKRNRDF